MIPVPRSAGNAIVQGPRTSRVGPPADATAGVAAIGRELVAGGQRMAQAQAELLPQANDATGGGQRLVEAGLVVLGMFGVGEQAADVKMTLNPRR